MKKIKCIAIDDNVSALNIITKLAESVDFIEIIEKFTDPVKAGKFLSSNSSVDLIFLDVNMPDMTGIEFLKTYKPKQQIIFISKDKASAVEGFEVMNEHDIDVIDFLPIPVKLDRFIRACNLAYDKGKEKEQFMILNENSIKFKIPYDDILYIEADETDAKYMNFHFKEGSMSHKNMKNPTAFRLTLINLMENILPSNRFLRISKNCIINLNYITQVKGEHIYIDGLPKKPLQLGDKYRDDFENYIEIYRK